jgi:hypothetical protein
MELPQEVIDLAGACVAAVQNAVGVELDFSQETLPVLDHYASMVDSPTDEIVSLIAPMCGAYFGEVVRRHLGDGRWLCPKDDYSQWRLRFEQCVLELNPIGTAVEVLLKDDAAGWFGHLQTEPRNRATVAQALEVYGSVRELDYYTFGVRFEAVEQAHLSLVHKATLERQN